MKPELYWLTLTVLMTALFWIPYILDRIKVLGLTAALSYPAPGAPEQSPWARRAMKAHDNSVENLVIFAPLVLTLNALGLSTGLTATAAMVYFFARLVYYFICLAGIPVARTLVFAIGWLMQIIIALVILGIF